MAKARPALWFSIALALGMVAAGLALLAGRPFGWQSGWAGPLGPLRLHGDWLSGVFLLLAGLLGIASAWTSRRQGPSVADALLPPFLLGLAAIPLASDTFTLLAAWELMSLSPGLMILLSPDAATRRAALLYLTYSQVSALALVSGLLLAAPGGGWTGGPLPGGYAPASLLLLLGCLVKAGIMPFHSWLPEAHPVAPGHVSALMSGAMVAMPAYLVVRLLLPHGIAAPWAMGVMLMGAASAALGSLHALHERNAKRVLALTTVSHMGMLFALLGTGLLLADAGQPLAGEVAAAAAAYALAHALAKGALFLVAGEVHHATGETSLERLGGLWRAWPGLAAAGGVGALGLAALPPLAGFPAEIAAVATLLAALPRLDAMGGAGVLGVLFLLAIGAGAGLAAVAKLVLGTFHGADRTARPVHPLPPGSWRPAGFLLAASALVGILPGILWARLPTGAAGPFSLPTPVGDAGFAGILAAGAAVSVLAALMLRAGRASKPEPRDGWNCGAPAPGPRQTYTPQGLVMPHRILFAEILRPTSDLHLQDAPVAPLAPRRGQYVERPAEYVEPWVHRPIVRFLGARIESLRRLHRGPVQAYLLVALLVLVAVLLLLPVLR